MMRTLFLLLTLVFTPLCWAQTLTFAIVPQQSAQKLASKWSPVMRYLSAQTGIELRFVTAQDIPTFEQRLADGEYDLAYMNPYHYTVFHQTPGYQAIARQSGANIQGIVVVSKDSPIKTLADLDGTKLAFPSPAAFAATVIPQAELRRQDVSYTAEYVSSHDSVYRAVAHAFFPAGGGIIRTLNNTAPDIREQIRVLWKSPEYTPHAFAVHPRIPPETVTLIQQALVAMDDSPEGKSLLAGLNMNGLQQASDQDWDDIRGLDINLLDKYLK